MNLLVIRHAIAEDLEPGDERPDAERQLTKRGKRRMRDAANGLARVVKRIDVLASSPLIRAKQTASIIGEAFDGLDITAVDALANKPVKDVLRWLQGQPADATVAVVGHEPQLGMLVSWLLSGEQKSFVEFRKGGACMLTFAKHVRAGQATLVWMLTPALSRKLGNRA